MPTSKNKNLVLVAMIFAVSMMFIDQTIVALAVPDLSAPTLAVPNRAQWLVNGYLLALSALFAFGGRLADVLGHRRMVTVGVAGFALFSALCGATPTGSARRTVDDHVPRAPGRLGRGPVPSGPGDRRPRVPRSASAGARWPRSLASAAA